MAFAAYAAVIELVPMGSVDVVRVAVPFDSEAVPRRVEPLLKVTVPDAALTVAVRVTASP
jgi:hypothetical protein